MIDKKLWSQYDRLLEFIFLLSKECCMGTQEVDKKVGFHKKGVGHNTLTPSNVDLGILILKSQAFKDLGEDSHATACMLIRFMIEKGYWAEFTQKEFYAFCMSQDKPLYVDPSFNGLFDDQDDSKSYLAQCPTKNEGDQVFYALKTSFIWLCVTA